MDIKVYTHLDTYANNHENICSCVPNTIDKSFVVAQMLALEAHRQKRLILVMGKTILKLINYA